MRFVWTSLPLFCGLLPNAQMYMVEPVVIGLVLLRSDVAPPRRAEFDDVEIVGVPDIGVTALRYAVEPPLERAGRELAVPLDAMPDTERDGGAGNVRGAPLEVARIFRQHVEPSVGTQDEKLLTAERTAAIEQEGDFVAGRTEIERRGRLPPKPQVDFTRIHGLVGHSRRRGALDHAFGIHEVVHMGR